MLGEGARTLADAERYLEYLRGRHQRHRPHGRAPHERSTVSIKLSALEPRYSAQGSGDGAVVAEDAGIDAARGRSGIELTINTEGGSPQLSAGR